MGYSMYVMYNVYQYISVKNTTISDKFNQGQSFLYNLSSICQNRLGPKFQQEFSTTVDA